MTVNFPFSPTEGATQHTLRALLDEPRPPRDLPARVPDFAGRTQELHALCDALRQGQHVALAAAVSGMGGVGKSALAFESVHVLAQEPDTFPGGMTWVRCDERTGLPGLIWVYDQVLAAWNVFLAPEELGRATTPEAEAEVRERVLRTRLRSTGSTEPRPRALVLLDNVERDLPLGRTLEALRALNITVLLTSRVEPSSPNLHLVRLDVLKPDAAVGLFAHRLAAKGGAWEVARDSPSAAEVVTVLGYLPLAIELAAARAARARMSVAALATELQQPGILARLKDPVDKTASVRYSLEKSLALLTPVQRARFAALGLPAGPDWPRPVVEGLLNAVPANVSGTDQAVDDLEVLVALSLVTIANQAMATLTPPAPPAGPPRVRLHPLLRELAREEWENWPAETHTAGLGALMASLGTLVAANASHYPTLEREEELIVGTVQRASREQSLLPAVGHILRHLQAYLVNAGRWRLGMELGQWYVAAAQQGGDQAEERLALQFLSDFAVRGGRAEEAEQALQHALAIARERGHPEEEVDTLNRLGFLLSELARKEAGMQYLALALAAAQKSGERGLEGSILHNLGALTMEMRRFDEAQGYLQRSLLLRRAVGDRLGEENTLHTLGALARGVGHTREAIQYFEQALEISQQEGDWWSQPSTLCQLGTLRCQLGDSETGMRCYEQALALARQTHDRVNEAMTLLSLSRAALALRRFEEAKHATQQGLTIAREVGNQRAEAGALEYLGEIALDMGKRKEALHYYEQALAAWQRVGEPPGLQGGAQMTLLTLGKLDSKRYSKQAAELLQQLAKRATKDSHLVVVGHMLRLLGYKAEAARYYEQALRLFQQEGNLDAARETLTWLTVVRQPTSTRPKQTHSGKRKPKGKR